jgi:hypothetical protein
MENVFKLLSITGKYHIIGSGADKKMKYKSDYDLMEYINVKKPVTLTDIYYNFLDKFKYAESHPNIFITDFKCGIDKEGEPLRWSYEDMKKGYKIVDGKHITFQDALRYKTTCKMDILAIIDKVFYEFSENYYFKPHINYYDSDMDENVIYNSLLHSYDDYMNVQRNYFKGLKRAYSIYKLKGDPKQKRLIPLFNSYLGQYNKIRSDIQVIKDMQEYAPKQAIQYNIKRIKDIIKGLKDGDKFHGSIDQIHKQLDKYINDKTLDFIKKNQDLLLD